MSSFRLAWLNLTRHRISSLLALLSISVSVACGGILLRLNQVSEQRFSSLGRGPEALIGAKSGGIEMILGALNGEGEYPGFLPSSLFESLRARASLSFEDGRKETPSSVRSITPFVYFGKLREYRVAGTDESFFRRWKSGEQLILEQGSWTGRPTDLVLGAAVAHHTGLKVGDAVEVDPWGGDGRVGPPVRMRVSGILRASSSQWDRLLYGEVVAAQAVLAGRELSGSSIWGARVLNYFLVDLEEGGFDSLASLVNRRTVGQAVRVETEISRLRDLSGAGRRLGVFVTVLVLFLGGLTVTSLLAARYDAMALQFAILRAIGYRRKAILGWLLWEGLLLGIGACFLGAALDALGFPLIRSALSGSLPPPEIAPSLFIDSFPVWGAALLATTLAVFLPVFRAYRQDVHFSLRS